jgi:hypothetical protein
MSSTLDPDERIELEVGPVNIRRRIETSFAPKIILLAAQGLGNDLIATRLDTPRQIVSKWRHRFSTTEYRP